MRGFSKVFFLTFLLGSEILTTFSSAFHQTCPDNSFNSICSSSSEIADLICFANRNYNGLSYVFINFNGDEVVAVGSFYYDCQPGIVYDLRIINVLGYLIRVRFAGKGSKSSKFFYINLVGDGPRIAIVGQTGTLQAVSGGLDPRLAGTALPQPLAYLVFQKLISNDYNAECNKFSLGREDDRCSCQSPYILRQPVETVSLVKCSSVVTGYLNNSADNVTGAVIYANVYGLSCVKCRGASSPQAESNPPIFVETCSTINYNRQQRCKYYGSPYRPQLSGNCDQDTLNNYQLCQLAQSYKSTYSRNDKKKSITSIAVIPQIYGEPNYPFMPMMSRSAISYFIVKGYFEDNHFEDGIMNNFSNICPN